MTTATPKNFQDVPEALRKETIEQHRSGSSLTWFWALLFGWIYLLVVGFNRQGMIALGLAIAVFVPILYFTGSFGASAPFGFLTSGVLAALWAPKLWHEKAVKAVKTAVRFY